MREETETATEDVRRLLERTAAQNPAPDLARLTVYVCGIAPDSGADMHARRPTCREQRAGRRADARQLPGAARARCGSAVRGGTRRPSSSLTTAEATGGAPAHSRFFLAIANHHLGRRQEAQRWLDKAVREYERQATATPPATTNRQADAANWQYPLTVRLLRAEAEALIASTPEKR